MPNTITKRLFPSEMDKALNGLFYPYSTKKIPGYLGFRQYNMFIVDAGLLHETVTVLDQNELSEALKYCKVILDQNFGIKRLVIPIAEKFSNFLINVEHFVAFVLDRNNNNGYTARVVDSKTPLNSSNMDKYIQKAFKQIFFSPECNFNPRYFSSQQGVLDQNSCGYFTIKASHELISNASSSIENIITNKSSLYFTNNIDWLTSDYIININNIINSKAENTNDNLNQHTEQGESWLMIFISVIKNFIKLISSYIYGDYSVTEQQSKSKTQAVPATAVRYNKSESPLSPLIFNNIENNNANAHRAEQPANRNRCVMQ